MQIVPASPEAFRQALTLLQSNDLPVEDISPGTQLFVMEEGNDVVGTIAVEYDYNTALLRSLSVDPSFRSKGLGQQLVTFIETYVKEQGVEEIFLLTTTAAGFFGKLGYTNIGREEVPPFIQNTSEFASVCPASAAVMKKSLQ